MLRGIERGFQMLEVALRQADHVISEAERGRATPEMLAAAKARALTGIRLARDGQAACAENRSYVEEVLEPSR